MKKILITIIIILLIVVSYNIIFEKGIKVGNLEILNYSSIQKKNESLKEKMDEINRLTSVTYKERYDSLISSGKDLAKVKEEYQAKIKYMSEENIEQINELEKYNVEFFWFNIGNYVTKHNVNQTLDLMSTGVSGIYDLKFTLVGGYINIADVLYDIEKDDRFNFRIEDFKIIPNSGTDTKGITENTFILQATFTIRNVPVDNFNVNTQSSSRTVTETINTTNAVDADTTNAVQ